jgi:ATP-dependent Clp protease ATP-binding subunit ClpA
MGAQGKATGGTATRERLVEYVREAFHAKGRFGSFTKRAKRAMELAQDEAKSFNHNYIGTEHILLGLLHEGEGVAAEVLGDLGVELDWVRGAVEHTIGRGDGSIEGEIGLTPRSKKALELAIDEARQLSHRYIGTEHLLLGLVREGDGIGVGVLETLGLDMARVRTRVLEVLASGRAPESGSAKGNVVTCRIDDRDVEAIDLLVEAGIRTTRSDAASWLIHAGIDTHQELFDRVRATVAEIRQLRSSAQTMAQELASRPASTDLKPGQTGDERGG